MCVVKCSACCSCFCSKCFMEMEGIFQDFFEKLKKKKIFQSNVGYQLIHPFSAQRTPELLCT